MENLPEFASLISEDEEIKFTAKGIPALIQSNIFPDINLVLAEGVLVLTTQRLLYKTSANQSFTLEFQNVISHGTQEQNLVCYLSDGVNAGDQNPANEEDEEDDESVIQENRQEEIDYLQFLAKESINSLISIQGDYELRFSFEMNPSANVEIAYEMFSECSALNPNDEADDDMNMLSLGGGNAFAGFDFDSMITAKDIDDNGNLIPGHLSANEDILQGCEEYDDGEDEDDLDEQNGEQDDKQRDEENSDMDIE